MPITDNFNRATLGTSWTPALGGAWEIVGSATARVQAAYGGNRLLVRTESSFPDDQYAQGKVKATQGGTFQPDGSRGGVAVRIVTDSAYVAYLTSGGSLVLAKLVAGVKTTLSTVSVAASANTLYTVKLVVAGTLLSVFFEGGNAINYMDSASPLLTGKPGLYGEIGQVELLGDYDDFESSDTVSTGGGGGSGTSNIGVLTVLPRRGPRTQFYRHRQGNVGSVLLPLGWFYVYTRAANAPEIFVQGAIRAGVTGRVNAPRAADIRVGDILQDYYDGRLLLVLQASLSAANLVALVVELNGPIADEFEFGGIDSYWSATSSGFSVEVATGELKQTNLSATLPSAGRLLYQPTKGDFDIYTCLRCDAGSSGAIRRALLAARNPTTGLGLYAGLKDNGTNATIIRLDETSAGVMTETTGPTIVSAAYAFIRLARTGAGLQVLYNTSLITPVAKTDWTVLAPSGTRYANVETLNVGMAGYTQTGAVGESRWQWLRNWIL